MEQLRYLIGLVTLLIVGISGWLLFDLLTDDKLSDRFHVGVVFEDVRGLRVGGDVRYRGVRVGQVVRVGVTDDGEKASIDLVLDESAEQLACVQSRFWIVSPRFDGVTRGASGLDTLVRDSYIAFLTPSPSGPRLAPNSQVRGLERPFLDPDDAGLDPMRHGDLEMFVHAAENHGLSVGNAVKYRGIRTGDVRAIQLAEDGTHVVLTVRIEQAHRHTVTDATEFWVARPRLSGALISGMAVEDLNAILSPYIGYHTQNPRGVPAPDGFHVIAAEARPEIEAAKFSIPAPTVPDVDDAQVDPKVRLVRVAYEAVEEDWLSANDHVQRSSTGLLFIDASGRAVVLTTRSACDAGWFMRDTFGTEPDIVKETVRIVLPGSSVLRAGRAWVDPNGADLALVVIEDAAPDLAVTASDRMEFSAAVDLTDAVTPAGQQLLSFGETAPIARPREIAPFQVDDGERGAVLLHGDVVVGLIGQSGRSDLAARVVSIQHLPAELRPAP